MLNIANYTELAKKLEKAIDEDINEDTELKLSHDEWRVVVKALYENWLLKMLIESNYEMANSPIVNPLEVGFRHTPYSDKEKLERLTQTCSFIAQDCLLTLQGIEEKK